MATKALSHLGADSPKCGAIKTIIETKKYYIQGISKSLLILFLQDNHISYFVERRANTLIALIKTRVF